MRVVPAEMQTWIAGKNNYRCLYISLHKLLYRAAVSTSHSGGTCMRGMVVVCNEGCV